MATAFVKYNKGEKIYTKKGLLTSWTYLEDSELRVYKSTKRRIMRVQCDCGKIKDVQYNNIRTGKSMCCGFDPCKIPHNKSKKSISTSLNSLLYAYKKGAEERGLCFTLTEEDFKTLIQMNCVYCDSPPKQIYRILNSKTGEVRAGIPLVYNGIDRKNNSEGYYLENSVTCCGICNRMKSSMNSEEFLSHINRIYGFQNCADIE